MQARWSLTTDWVGKRKAEQEVELLWWQQAMLKLQVYLMLILIGLLLLICVACLLGLCHFIAARACNSEEAKVALISGRRLGSRFG